MTLQDFLAHAENHFTAHYGAEPMIGFDGGYLQALRDAVAVTTSPELSAAAKAILGSAR